jgi:hypothetical protein
VCKSVGEKTWVLKDSRGAAPAGRVLSICTFRSLIESTQSMTEQVEVYCRSCGKPFLMDRGAYEVVKDIWDENHPICPACVRELWKAVEIL